MNKTERAKVAALMECRLSFIGQDIAFVRNMHWLRANEPGKVLKPRQKWALDVLVYKYRSQLGGRDLDFFDIPPEPPVLADYGVREDAGAKQRNIFGGEDKPRPTKIEPGEGSPQRRLW